MKPRLIGTAAAVGAVGLSIWLIWIWLNPSLSAETEGTVMSIRTTAQNTECCPVTVEFTDHQGVTHSFHSSSGGRRSHQVGDSITVYFDPDDPSRAQTGKDRITPFAVGGFGVFVLAIIATLYLVQGRRRST